MTPCADQMRQVYARVASILQRPEVFGLGPSAPQPLADALEGVMGTLGQAIDQEEQPIPEEGLEEELHQDADEIVSTAC
jgi:hypothetical protein